jgi:hypothetical protein
VGTERFSVPMSGWEEILGTGDRLGITEDEA